MRICHVQHTQRMCVSSSVYAGARRVCVNFVLDNDSMRCYVDAPNKTASSGCLNILKTPHLGGYVTSSQATRSLSPLQVALAGGDFPPSNFVQCFSCGTLLNEESDNFLTCEDCHWAVCSHCATCACDCYSVVTLESLFSECKEISVS
jgi:hypothetical protein